MKLSKAQLRALGDFAQAGGHGFGEYAYLSVSTAQALERRGLVTLGVRRTAAGRSMGWGNATIQGLQALAEHRAGDVRGSEPYKAELGRMLRHRRPEEIARYRAQLGLE